jgi:hypothetical protein
MMMMMHPSPSTSEFPLPAERHYGNHVDTSDFRRDDVKLPTAVKRKDNYLKVYARKFGLNDRGCYVACVLGGLAFFFFVIIVAMAATWPGKSILKPLSAALTGQLIRNNFVNTPTNNVWTGHGQL